MTNDIEKWEQSRQALTDEYLQHFSSTVGRQLESVNKGSDTEEQLEDTLSLIAEVKRLRSMALYEGVNGRIGESYLRVYAWAENEEDARALISRSFNTELEKRIGRPVSTESRYLDLLTITKLFSADAPPFATKPDDNGWEIDE